MDTPNTTYIAKILETNGLTSDFNQLSAKQVRNAKKKLKRQLKELEFLSRTGGITIIAKDEVIITTYHNL